MLAGPLMGLESKHQRYSKPGGRRFRTDNYLDGVHRTYVSLRRPTARYVDSALALTILRR